MYEHDFAEFSLPRYVDHLLPDGRAGVILELSTVHIFLSCHLYYYLWLYPILWPHVGFLPPTRNETCRNYSRSAARSGKGSRSKVEPSRSPTFNPSLSLSLSVSLSLSFLSSLASAAWHANKISLHLCEGESGAERRWQGEWAENVVQKSACSSLFFNHSIRIAKKVTPRKVQSWYES